MSSSRKPRKAERGRYQKTFHPYPFEKNTALKVTVLSLSNHGHGVAKVDYTPKTGEPVKDWVIFIPFALPEETINIKITHNAKQHSLAEILEIKTPSVHRVEPLCKHFFFCGGCQFQHLNYPQQLYYQQMQVAQLLERIAKVEHPVLTPIASPQIWNYRSKINPQYKKPKQGKIAAIGFHHHSEKNTLIDVQQCAIAMPQLNAALPEQKKQLRSQAKTLRKDGELLLRVNQEKVETSSSGVVEESVGELRFFFLAGDFFQNNPFILPKFVDYVARQASATQLDFLVDAYCGCGLFSLSLAKNFKQVVGVEVSATSADWARHNARYNEIENCAFFATDAEHIFSHIDFPAKKTAVVIDPPRAGCSQNFIEQLCEYRPQRLIYVSCEPATQMRDLAKLTAFGYRILEVQPFDLFPHTRHLECVITLEMES